MGFQKIYLLIVILIVALLTVPTVAASTAGDDPSLPFTSSIYETCDTSELDCHTKSSAFFIGNSLADFASFAMIKVETYEASADQFLDRPILIRPQCPHRGPPNHSLHQA